MQEGDQRDADEAVGRGVADFERPHIVERLFHGVTATGWKEARHVCGGRWYGISGSLFRLPRAARAACSDPSFHIS